MAAYYEFIRVYGLKEHNQECFQGLGASAVYGSTTPSTTLPAVTVQPDELQAFDTSLWEVQTDRIQAQSVFVGSVADAFKGKRDKLPESIDTWEEFLEKCVELFASYLIGWLIDKLVWDVIPDWLRVEVGQWLVSMILDVYRYLKSSYEEGIELTAKIQEENAALAKMTPSWENYDRRARSMAANVQEIQNLIEYTEKLETQAMKFQETQLNERTIDELGHLAMQDITLSNGAFRISWGGKLVERM